MIISTTDNVPNKEITEILEDDGFNQTESWIFDGYGYSVILFMDEFYRAGSTKIRNILRTILNGNIGTDKIPPQVYILFASNFDNSDGSLDEIPLNHQFDNVQFDVPSKDDFMQYIANGYTTFDVETGEEDDYGHKKLGGVGQLVAEEIKRRTGQHVMFQQPAYLMRSGAPDSLDRMVAMCYGNLATQC